MHIKHLDQQLADRKEQCGISHQMRLGPDGFSYSQRLRALLTTS
jgi:hypothetical protein